MVGDTKTPTTGNDTDLDGEEYAAITEQFGDLDQAIASKQTDALKLMRDHVFDLTCRVQELEDRIEKDEEAM
jgi:predicted  nucleic acid-binding Zn-ribbon protein